MAKTLNARIITKHDTAENWEKATSFKPKLGEIIVYETPSNTILNQYDWESIPRIKIGDGETVISKLPFITDAYVQKKRDYGLSERNYNQTHWDIVNGIANLGYVPKYTDTTYEAGRGMALSEDNIFYNTGVLSLYTDIKNPGIIYYRSSKGPHEEDGNEDKSIELGLKDTAFMESNNFLKIEDFEKEHYVVELKENEDIENKPGTILYRTYNDEEYKSVKVNGLKSLAFKDAVDIDTVTEVVIAENKPTDNIPIWIDCSVDEEQNVKGKLKYLDKNNEDEYVEIDVGVVSISPKKTVVNENEELDEGFVVNTKNISIEQYFGVQKIACPSPYSLEVTTNGKVQNYNIGEELQFQSGIEGDIKGSFRVIRGSNEIQHVEIFGLGDNAFTSTAYFPIAGGTITGDTIFSSITASNSTDTGAVCITGGLGVGGNIYGNAVYGAVYNDYAEYRQSEEPIEPGYIVYSGDDGILHKTVGRLQFFEGVVSDTFGFSIGKTDKAQTPLAVAGRVLVYTDEELHAGNVVCAGPHGKACKMTKKEIKEHPDRIVGIVSEVPNYETWGEENAPVNGRVWIRVR